MKIENLIILGIVGFVLIRGLIGFGTSGVIYTGPAANFKLPITQHADGHFYDANGVFVS